MADLPNKRLARIKEKTMCWKFNMLYNPEKMQNATNAISWCKPLHMLYISASQTPIANENADFKELLQIYLDVVHNAINSVSSDTEDTMMSWNRVHRATQEDG